MDGGAPGLDHRAPVGLLVVADADHEDLALEPEHAAGERQRRAPLARPGLGRRACGRPPACCSRPARRRCSACASRPARPPRTCSRCGPGYRARAPGGGRGAAASGARAGRPRAPPRGSRSPARPRPPARSVPSGRSAPGPPGPAGSPVAGLSGGSGSPGRSGSRFTQLVGISDLGQRELDRDRPCARAILCGCGRSHGGRRPAASPPAASRARRAGRGSPAEAVAELRQVRLDLWQLLAYRLGIDAEQGLACPRRRSRGPRCRCRRRAGTQADRRLHRLALAVAAAEDPLEHADVLAEAGPEEVALVVLAEPVDEEDLRQLRRRRARRRSPASGAK